jgi:NodT family efflux transporter outer membrane factor (OMF) lipoprotein
MKLMPVWRTHSCVPCSHSCEHKVAKKKGVHTSVNAARLGACATVLCLALTSCMVGPKYHPPATAQAPPAYKELNPPPNQPAPLAEPAADPTLGGLGDWKPANPQDTLPHGKWWEIYNDPELSALETQLNIDNQNIRQFFENFMAARALVREARSQLFPTATVGANYSRSRGSANLGSNIGATGTTSGKGSTGLIDLPLDVSWEPDLWGRVRNTIRQAQYNAQVSAADLENERLTEQASLATFFFEIRGQDALRQILDATVAQDQKALELTTSQYNLGLTDRIAVVQAETTLQSAQAQATNLGVARAQYEHAIALLVGKSASDFSLPVKPVLTTPPPIPVGLPSQLLERRPDIAAAERTMAAANAQIGISTAAFYPNLTISASAGLESSLWSKIFSWPSRFWSVGPQLSETIFDAGLRRATVNQFTAVYNADVAAYRQTVLAGFQQVEDALAAVRILTQQIQQQHQAVESARVALDLEMKRYETGIDPYIDVVTEQNALLSAQQILALIEIQRMTQSVSLIEALGGGWDRSELVSPQQVTAKPAKSDTTIQP